MRAGEDLEEADLVALLSSLDRLELSGASEGRSLVLRLSQEELARRFGRGR